VTITLRASRAFFTFGLFAEDRLGSPLFQFQTQRWVWELSKPIGFGFLFSADCDIFVTWTCRSRDLSSPRAGVTWSLLYVLAIFRQRFSLRRSLSIIEPIGRVLLWSLIFFVGFHNLIFWQIKDRYLNLRLITDRSTTIQMRTYDCCFWLGSLFVWFEPPHEIIFLHKASTLSVPASTDDRVPIWAPTLDRMCAYISAALRLCANDRKCRDFSRVGWVRCWTLIKREPKCVFSHSELWDINCSRANALQSLWDRLINRWPGLMSPIGVMWLDELKENLLKLTHIKNLKSIVIYMANNLNLLVLKVNKHMR